MRSLKINVTVRSHIIIIILKKLAEIWKVIRSLVNIKASKSSIKLLNENDNLVSDTKIISNVFNNYFSSIGPVIERKLPNGPGSFTDYFEKKDKNGKLIDKPI